ncbi:MAG: thioredoxin-dependent thiol peroxidase [Acidobacteriota bacterium]
MSLEVGDAAPKIKSTDFSLSDHKGQTVVVFFYPKSDTPGCTQESCDFRDLTPKFTKKNVVIVGISPDKAEAQAKFAEKYGLPYSFVPDTDHAVAEAYGVWKEKKNYGKTYMGIERSTFVIDPAGKIAKIYPRVKVAGHAEKVLGELA